MKFAVVLGLVAVALASQHWDQRPENINEHSFRAGKHYEFKFDGQIAAGLPHPSSQLSLTRIQSLVSLVFENDRSCLFKMQKTRMGSAHREVSEPREVQPFGLFEESEMTPEQKEQLSLPVRFRYEQGIISDIEFDREEQTWSANIKRSILNMLQINMGKQMRTNEKEMQRVSRSESEMEESTPMDFYTTQEKTLEGDCETAYTLVPTGEKQIRVSKSVNFEKCIRRVDIRYNMNFGEECPSCEKKYLVEEKNTESTSVFKFELSYENTPSSFIIREAEVKSAYVHAPLSKEHPIASTFVANKLTLIKISGQRDVVSAPSQPKQKESLLYSTEWEDKLQRFRMTGEESLLRESPYTWMTKKIEIASRLFQELRREMASFEKKEQMTEEYTPEVNRILSELVKIMRVATKKELSQLYREVEKDSRCAHIFFDACAISGTKNTIEFLTEKVVEKQVSPLKAARLVKMLTNVPTPSEQIVDSLIRFTKEEICQRNPVLKQSTWLSVGALLNNLCASEDLTEKKSAFEPVCRRETKEKYVQILERMYETAETRYEKILALKTLANAGFDLVVFPLEKIIRDERVEKTIRMQAIDGLRQVRKLMPRKVQSLLMPLYKNIREYPEIRVAAFHQIMQTLPERVVIDQIVAQLNKEPSAPVAAFVYSTLQQYTKTEIPCEKDLARDIEQSLRLTRYQPRAYPAYLRATFYNERLFSGAAINWAALFSSDSVLPKELSASLDTLFAGSWTKYFAQIGLYQHNVDQWLFRLVEKLENNEMPEYSMDDVIVRGKRAALPKASDLLKQLMSKMGISQRRPTYEKEDAHAILYLRYKDLDFAVLPLEERTLTHFYKQISRNGKIHLDEIERVLAQGYDFELHAATFGYEKTRMLPTTLGLPLEVSIKMPTVLSVAGKLTAELEPKRENSIEGVRVHLRAQPKIASTHVISMEARCPVTSNGVAMTHSALISVPVDAELSLNWARKFDAKLTIRAPEQRREQKILSAASRPITYIRYESEPKKCESTYEKTVFAPRSEQTAFTRVELDSTYGEELLGMRFNVRGNVHRHLIQEQPSRSFPLNAFVPALNGENHVEITMEKQEDAPREYVIRMNVDAFEKEEKISEHPEEFEQFYDKDNEEHFEVEDSEYVPENEKERRTEFGSYIKNWKKEQRPAYKGRMHIKAEAVGGRVEKKAQMEIIALCSAEFSYCSWKLDARRSPLLQEERSEWQMTASLQTLMPRFVRSFDELREQKHREISAILKAIWGSEQKNSIRARVQLSQDKHQQKWQALTLKKENIEENYERLVLASRLNQVKIVADYKIHPETLVHFNRVNALLKAWQPLCEVQPRSLEAAYKPEGQLLVSLTVEPQTWRYANLSVVSPSERVNIENIRLPFRPVFVSIEKRERMPRTVSELARKIVKSPVCEVSSSKVNTFDEVIYRAPLTTCYSILAKDCSEQPQFAILMKKISKNSEEKKMKIVTQEKIHEIEMKKNGDFVVKVDGKKINERDLEQYKMEQLGEKIIFETEDFKIRFDGYNAQIEIAEYYKEQQCGICGHFDGERKGEFRRADNQETENIEEFHRSFLSQDEECEMEEEKLKEKKNYKKYTPEEEQEEQSYETEENEWNFEEKIYKKKNFQTEENDETVEPKEQTLIIEHSSRICFSQKPVVQCPRDTYAKEAKEMKIKFSCLERSEPEARRMLREARFQILNIENMPVSFVDTVRVPKTCTVY